MNNDKHEAEDADEDKDEDDAGADADADADADDDAAADDDDAAADDDDDDAGGGGGDRCSTPPGPQRFEPGPPWPPDPKERLRNSQNPTVTNSISAPWPTSHPPIK